MSRILIAGCGYVGCALGARLVADGHEVHGLRRDTSALPEGTRPVRADVTTGDGLATLPAGVDFLVYAAAPGGGDVSAYAAVYSDGLRRVVDALRASSCGLQRVLFTSSTSVYETRDGAWVDETTPITPESTRAGILLDAEGVAAGAPWPSTVVRLGGIYGPGRTRLLEQVRRGEAVCEAGSPVYTNRIHRDDAAGILRHLMLLPDALSLYVGVDRDPAERCRVLDWLAERMGAPKPRRVAAVPGPRARSNKRCSSKRLSDSGYRFLYPSFRNGYADLIRGQRVG